MDDTDTDDEWPEDAPNKGGRPVGARDSYARQRVSTRQLRSERLHELGEVLIETGNPEVQNTLARIVLALMLSGWTVAEYLSNPNMPDIIERLLAPVPTVAKPAPKRKARRSLTGYDGL